FSFSNACARSDCSINYYNESKEVTLDGVNMTRRKITFHDVEFLIEQSERAQALEKENEKAYKAIKHEMILDSSYREALEFYADKENYVEGPMEVELDGGEKARQALEGISNE